MPLGVLFLPRQVSINTLWWLALVIVVSSDVCSSVQSISAEHEISWSWLGSHSSWDRSSSELVVPMLGSWAWIVAN